MCAWTPTSSTQGRSSSAATAFAAAPDRDGETELGVLLPRSDEVVRVRLDAGCHPGEDLGPGRRRRGQRVQQASEAGDLVEGVDDDPGDTMLQRRRELVGRLVVAVEHETVRGDAGRERDVELTTRGDIEAHALLVGQPCHGSAQERLGGVRDAVAPGGDGVAARVPQVVLVVDEQRRAEFLGQLEEVDAADVEVAFLVHGRRSREEVALQGCGHDIVVGRHGDAGYGSVWMLLRSGRWRDRRRWVASTIVPCSCNARPRSSADRAPASGAGGAGSSPAGGAEVPGGAEPPGAPSPRYAGGAEGRPSTTHAGRNGEPAPVLGE